MSTFDYENAQIAIIIVMSEQYKQLTGVKNAAAMGITIALGFFVFLSIISVSPENENLGGLLMISIFILGAVYSQTGSFKKTLQDLSQGTVQLIRRIAYIVIVLSVVALLLLILFGVFSWIASLPSTSIIIFLLVLILFKK